MSEMSDEEFLDYCDGMTETERCGFVPKQLARLLRLAGEEALAIQWEAQPNQIVDHIHDDVTRLVIQARGIIKSKEAVVG